MFFGVEPGLSGLASYQGYTESDNLRASIEGSR